MKTLEQPSHVSTNFQYMPYLKVKLKILLIASEMSQIKNVHYWDEEICEIWLVQKSAAAIAVQFATNWIL